jgi:hypothetical protein
MKLADVRLDGLNGTNVRSRSGEIHETRAQTTRPFIRSPIRSSADAI